LKTAVIISIISIIVMLSINSNSILLYWRVYLYAKVLGPQTVMHTNPDKTNCRQGNIFDGVTRQARFTASSTCEKVVGIVHDMKETREPDGD
jgi:hypothetical protein